MNPKAKQVTSEIITVLLSLIILLPIFMMIINSFKDYAGATRLSLTLYDISIKQIIINYSDMLKESHLLTAYKNSAIITFISVFLIVFVGAVSAFIIQRRQNRITKLVNLMFILGISIPFVAPSAFFLVKQLGLSQTYSGIILIYLATSLTTSIILFTGYYKSISTNLDESAIIDGCGPVRLFFNVIFPLILPVTVTVIILSVIGIWNDFGIAVYFLNTPRKFTVVMTTFNFNGQLHATYNLLFANIVLISAPIVVIYLFLQKYIVSGLTSGSVKG